MPDKPPVFEDGQPIDLFTALGNIAQAAKTAHYTQTSFYREKLLCIEAAASIALASNDPVMMRVALEEILTEARK